jgi:transcriptional regulator with XRE-family HTH domain
LLWGKTSRALFFARKEMKNLNREEHPIRKLRIDKRISQLKLALMLDISQAKLSQWENAAIHTPDHIITKIAKIFKINRDGLRRESDDFYKRKKEKLMQKYR